MKKAVCAVISMLLTAFILDSCQKTDVNGTYTKADSANIFNLPDSTMIIKSITYKSSAGTGTQYFFYDTANRKIIVSMQPITSATGDYTDGQEFSYDAFGMLIHISGKFSGPADVYFTSADYFYDDQHVLSGAHTILPGLDYSASYTKTHVAGGYLLSELYTLPSSNGYTDSNYSAALVDDSGRLAAFYTVYNNTEPGDPTNTSPNGDTYFYFTDSLVYDAAGNLVREWQTYPPDFLKPDSLVRVAIYDFSVRDTKGDQLHNLGKTLFRGIGHLPFTIIDFFAGQLSLMGDVGLQVYKYPALHTTIIVADTNRIFNTQLDFNTPAEYDVLNRLLKYHNFAHYPPYEPYDIMISYYK